MTNMTLKLMKGRGTKAMSPAVSSVIITGVMVALITVAFAFANNYLQFKIAENEYDSAKQSLQTLGLQIDDVAWTIGRTETIRYSGRDGGATYHAALNYTVYINTTLQANQKLYTNLTGIVSFNMPVSRYSLGNNYFQLFHPASSTSFLLDGASAPVTRIFGVEKLPMIDGNYLRVVCAPTIRMVHLSIANTSYVRLYLPLLGYGESPRLSQSITLTGNSVSKVAGTVTGIRIEVGFPLEGFDNSFFNFSKVSEAIALEEETILELFVGGVDVAFGVHA
jgi:hypothetical protein